MLTHFKDPNLCVCCRAVPKFMKRIKVRDYKDRNVFGVPLQVIVQRTGQPLPQGIQQAMRYLRNQCLDQVIYSTEICTDVCKTFFYTGIASLHVMATSALALSTILANLFSLSYSNCIKSQFKYMCIFVLVLHNMRQGIGKSLMPTQSVCKHFLCARGASVCGSSVTCVALI